MRGVDLAITAEGRLDRQTLNGKLPHAVSRRAEPTRTMAITTTLEYLDMVERLLREAWLEIATTAPVAAVADTSSRTFSTYPAPT